MFDLNALSQRQYIHLNMHKMFGTLIPLCEHQCHRLHQFREIKIIYNWEYINYWNFQFERFFSHSFYPFLVHGSMVNGSYLQQECLIRMCVCVLCTFMSFLTHSLAILFVLVGHSMHFSHLLEQLHSSVI